MMVFANKRSYKGISLFIKTVILIFSFCYIWQKIVEANKTIDFSTLLEHPAKSYLFIVFLLMFVNWGIEALKWQFLIRSLETISFFKSIESVFAGVTISIFTPSRVGEFVGRIFFLEQADKIEATLKSFVGSLIQLLITVLGGVAAYFILEIYHDGFHNKGLIPPDSVFMLVFCFLLSCGFMIFIYSKRNKQLIHYKKYIEAFTNYTARELLLIFSLSLFRYLIFSVQYFLILEFLGVEANTFVLFSLIALTFFVTSVIPTFSLTEIAVRGATAVYFFSIISIDSVSIITASILLWMINLAIPAVIGGLFIFNLKFIRE